jgi:hypothetical protein
MRLSQTDQSSGSLDSFSEAGPSSNGLSTNGSAKPTNTYATNGASSNGVASKKVDKGQIAKVSLPGSNLFGDTHIDREEFVRLVIQSLREVGYVYVFFSVCMLDYIINCCVASRLLRSRQSRGTRWSLTTWLLSGDIY